MEKLQHIINKPVIKIGLLLGTAFVLAQYIFYFGGRSVILNTTFSSTLQLLTIMGLYFGLYQCRKLNPQIGFWKLLLYGIIIVGIAVFLRTLFSILLYGVLAPELGTTYKEALSELLNQALKTMQNVPEEGYQEATQIMLNPVSIPIIEGITLFFMGTSFSIFIAALLNMFRK